MKFEEVLPALRAGKKVRRSSWCDDVYFKLWDVGSGWMTVMDFIADDWEIVKEKVERTVFVNVFQGQHGFVTDGLHDSRVEAARCSCGFDRPHLGIYSFTVEVEE